MIQGIARGSQGEPRGAYMYSKALRCAVFGSRKKPWSQGEPRGAYNMKYASMYDHKPKYLLAPMIFD